MRAALLLLIAFAVLAAPAAAGAASAAAPATAARKTGNLGMAASYPRSGHCYTLL